MIAKLNAWARRWFVDVPEGQWWVWAWRPVAAGALLFALGAWVF